MLLEHSAAQIYVGNYVKCTVDTHGSALPDYCTLDGIVSQLLFQSLLTKQSNFRTVPSSVRSVIAVERSKHHNPEKQ